MGEPHVYIYIYNRDNPGGKGKRKIVPATCIKNFRYDNYVQDHDKYKDKILKVKEGASDEKVCYVLYAAETYDLVETYIAENKKRFRIPNLDLSDVSSEKTINTEEGTDDQQIMRLEEVQKTKKKRKVTKAKQKESAKETAGSIIQNYIHEPNEPTLSSPINHSSAIEEEEEEENINIGNDFIAQNSRTERSNKRPPCNEVTNSRSNNATASTSADSDQSLCNAYKMQMLYFKQKYEESIKAQGLTKMQSNEQSEPKATLDVIFQASHKVTNCPQSNANALSVEEQTENFIILNRGVKCNALAYKDAFKTDRFQTFFTTMNLGIYGAEELATRQVKSVPGSKKRELSPHKKEVVEDEFYKFLSVQQYPVHIITQQMNKSKLNSYHHNSISTAVKKLKREEARKALQELAEEEQSSNRE